MNMLLDFPMQFSVVYSMARGENQVSDLSTITYYNVNFHMQTIASFKTKEAAESYAAYERICRTAMIEKEKDWLTASEYAGIKSSVERAITVRKIDVHLSDGLV